MRGPVYIERSSDDAGSFMGARDNPPKVLRIIGVRSAARPPGANTPKDAVFAPYINDQIQGTDVNNFDLVVPVSVPA